MNTVELGTVLFQENKIVFNGTIEQCVDWMRRNGTAGVYALHTLYPGAIIAGQRVVEFGWTERGGVYWRGEKVEK